MAHGGFILAAIRRPRGCLLRSLLSLFRYAALRGSVNALVARGKRSAPAKQCVGGAIGARELTSDKMIKQGALRPFFVGECSGVNRLWQ